MPDRVKPHQGSPGKAQPQLRFAILCLPAMLVAFATLLALPSVSPGVINAEAEPQFVELKVTVIPEYDQPKLLVIYRGELPADTLLPAKINLRLPKDATTIQTCSSKPPDDDLACSQPVLEPNNDYLAVRYDVTTPVMYVEYYYGFFAGAGRRSLDFNLWLPYPSKTVEVAIPVPPDATDFTASPEPARTVNEQGTKHYIYSFNDVPADKPVAVQLAYSRPTDKPWGQPPTQNTAGQAGDPNDDGGIPTDAILFAALAAALALLFVGYNTIGRRVRFDMGLTAESRRGRQGSIVVYCHRCGEPAGEGATFCSRCGGAVRAAPRREA